MIEREVAGPAALADLEEPLPSPLFPRVLLLDNIGELVTLSTGWDDMGGPRRGEQMRELGIIRDAAVLCLDGENAAYGDRKKVAAKLDVLDDAAQAMRFDCQHGVVLPGFCDSH